MVLEIAANASETPANFDLVASPVLASPDPCSKCACDDIAFQESNPVWINVGSGCVCTPVAPILLSFSGRFRCDAIGSRSPHRQRITEEIWLVDKGHSRHNAFCSRGKLVSKYEGKFDDA